MTHKKYNKNGNMTAAIERGFTVWYWGPNGQKRYDSYSTLAEAKAVANDLTTADDWAEVWRDEDNETLYSTLPSRD